MYGRTQITMFQTGYANSRHCKALLIEIETCWCRKMCNCMVDFCRNDAERRTEESNISRSNPARALARLHSDSSFTHHGQLIYANSNADYVTSRRFLSRTMTILPPTFIPTICLYVCNKHFNNSLFCSHLRNAMQKRNHFVIREDNPKRVIIQKYKKSFMWIFRKRRRKQTHIKGIPIEIRFLFVYWNQLLNYAMYQFIGYALFGLNFNSTGAWEAKKYALPHKQIQK